MRKRNVTIWAMVVVLLMGVSAKAYYNDFESVAGTEWSKSIIANTPIGGRHFLGEFGSETVNLTLNNLVAHTSVLVSFDLFILKSWDGEGPAGDASGPDIWGITADNSNFNFITTFSNIYSGKGGWPVEKKQKYPNQWPDGDEMPPFSGASEINTLGYYHPAGPLPMDSVYRLSFYFEHNTNALSLNFTASLTNQTWDESWGLDNVSIQTIPEPATLILLSLGGLFLRRKY